VNRLMRVAYGPIALDSALTRGRHRELTAAERALLYGLAELAAPEADAAPRPSSRKPSSRKPSSHKPSSRRKRVVSRR
jgi:hypothetical protein